MAENETWQNILNELDAGHARHLARVQPAVQAFVREAEERYASETKGFIALYQKDKPIQILLNPILLQIQDYILWLRWVAWNVSNLGPILFPAPAKATERLALATLAYASGRLIDDGLDNHETFKGHRSSLVGLFRARMPSAPAYAACVQSAFVGFSLFHHTLQRLRQCGYEPVADDISRLFKAASVGVLAECFTGPVLGRELYQQIVRRKAVAYNMILYRPFLFEVESPTRLPLLRILAGMDELAQLINDYHDRAEDQSTGQMNALTHGVYSVETIQAQVKERFQQLWETSRTLPSNLQDGLAAMFVNLGIPDLFETETSASTFSEADEHANPV